ncbi:hypothetical protein HZH66_015034 [Vespula vulgaris]|uniref:Uncharacterized protein n=1 Tax=Vespula vulgaris TaxID=7454 RepID=A0A834MMQ5_VESVU|nr:hypothetical protein HZH66_015034 [Vespula vulgaris]
MGNPEHDDLEEKYYEKGGVNAGLEISAVIRIRIITADVFNICNVSDSSSGCYSSGGGSGTSGVNGWW